ncbi:uncharacterized protein [Chelonus insularis]|uniref:uncharacterized protein n=1 Tax=Chelonus insularis TaxID=460826 RepID=UPI00158E04D7|nr:uncharacterized protein LOC118069749 [Chelonus insularis]
MIAFFAILVNLLANSSAVGVGKAWEISSNTNAEHTTHPTWPRLDLSAFEVRSISGVGRLASRESSPTIKIPETLVDLKEFDQTGEVRGNRIAKELEDMEDSRSPELLYDHPLFKGAIRNPNDDVEVLSEPWEKETRRKARHYGSCSESHEKPDETSLEIIEDHSRIRREADENQMEKISGTKSAREPRLGSPESWSTQPLSVEFRHRTDAEEAASEDDETSRSPSQRDEAPRTDFITANRRNYDVRESRESRDFPISRTYDDVSFRTPLRDREFDATYSRGYYYPDHFRTEREYYVRGLNEPTAYSSDRYRIEDYDLYRNRPTPKPKRIIYYATLPEIVRKPVDLRSYQRPHDHIRPSIPMMTRDGFPKKIPNMMDRDVETRYRYRSYPYGGYDPYIKRSTYLDRPYVHYTDRVDEVRYLDQNLDHDTYKEVRSADEAAKLLADPSGARRQEKLPWPVQIGTEINVKDNQKVSGRKIFGQYQDYDRFRPSTRIERKESTDNPGLEARN